MLTIRHLVLDGVALLGVVAGVAAGIGGYFYNLPDPPETVAVTLAEWTDPETTGSITPKVRHDQPRIWIDPPDRRSRW